MAAKEAQASSTVLFLAGAVSGIVEAFCVQPFDMVKTRHQLNTGTNLGVISTLLQLYREGGVRLWYRGISAELVGMVPKSAAMYGTYGVVHRHLVQETSMGDVSLAATTAGLVAAIPEAIIVTPAQIVKVRLQAREHTGKYHGSVDCVQKLFRQEGLRAFSIGLAPTIIRNGVWNSVYFGVMHKIKQHLPTPPTGSGDLYLTAQTFLSGFCGALIATCFNAPFDVVKSRFQCQVHDGLGCGDHRHEHHEGGTTSGSDRKNTVSSSSNGSNGNGNGNSSAPLKYRRTLQSLVLIYREEGLASCYKGFRPKAVRMGLGGAVAITVYDLFVKVAS